MVHSTPLYRRKMTGRYQTPKYVLNYSPNTPKIENIVTMIDPDTIADLNEICSKIPIIEYRPERFAAAILRLLKKSGSTFLLYSTAKLVTAGTKRPLEAAWFSHWCLTIFGNVKRKIYKYNKKTMRVKKGYPKYIPLCRWLRFSKMNIANIVGKSSIDKNLIYLNEIHRNNRKNTDYSPTTFPAVRVKLDNCSASIFDTGYKLILGIKDPAQLSEANKIVDKMIMEGYESKKATDAIRGYIWSTTHEDRIDKTAKNDSDNVIIPKITKNKKNRFEKRIESHLYANNKLIYTNTNIKMDLTKVKNKREILSNFNIYSFEEKARKLY